MLHAQAGAFLHCADSMDLSGSRFALNIGSRNKHQKGVKKPEKQPDKFNTTSKCIDYINADRLQWRDISGNNHPYHTRHCESCC